MYGDEYFDDLHALTLLDAPGAASGRDAPRAPASLQLLCEATLSEALDDETVCDLLSVAHDGSCAALKANCLQYIQRTFGVFADGPARARDHLQLPGWRQLHAKTPALRPDLDHARNGL